MTSYSSFLRSTISLPSFCLSLIFVQIIYLSKVLEMRIFMFILGSVLLMSCKEQMNSSREQSVEDHLTNGEWRLISSDTEFRRFQDGLKFSADKQVFNIDSQGRIVSPSHERIYTISADTLKIVDYKYEEAFLFREGTDILIIEELTDDEMVLQVIHPQGPNKLYFENLK